LLNETFVSDCRSFLTFTFHMVVYRRL